jgi:hypothetical protein
MRSLATQPTENRGVWIVEPAAPSLHGIGPAVAWTQTRKGGIVDNAKRKASKRGRRPESRAKAMASRKTTLGDLIAAAFDTVGSEVRAVSKLVSSSDMARMIGRRIVLI